MPPGLAEGDGTGQGVLPPAANAARKSGRDQGIALSSCGRISASIVQQQGAAAGER